MPKNLRNPTMLLSLSRKMLKLCSCAVSLGSAFHCLITLTNREGKKQFTLANGCLNLNEWFDLVLARIEVSLTNLQLFTRNLVPRVSHLTAPSSQGAVRWETLGTRLVYARTSFFNIFKFLKSRNRKCTSFSLLRTLISKGQLSDR